MYTFYKDNLGEQPIGSVEPLGEDELIYVANLTCDGPVPNDEARSVSLSNIPAYTTLTVWDSPCGMPGKDDWCTITTLTDIGDTPVHIETFEQTQRTGQYSQTYYRVNGLDGKVSLISVSLGRISSTD